MKALAIKTKKGYISYTGISKFTNDLREAFLYLTIENAREQLCNTGNTEGAEIIPVEIELIDEKTGYEHIAKVLLEKLTSKELAELCDAYDDGCIETIFMETLLPRDIENRPKEYAESDDDEALRK